VHTTHENSLKEKEKELKEINTKIIRIAGLFESNPITAAY